MKNQAVDYQAPEASIHSESVEEKSSFASHIARIWNRIVESIIAVNELKIYSLKSRSGSGCWAIHDSFSGRRIFFNSEEEVREWLDKRYYQ